jgi:hypothetical protein
LGDRQTAVEANFRLIIIIIIIIGLGSSFGIATGYGMDGPGIESVPGAHPASCTMGTGSFVGVKRPGRDADHPPPPSAEVDNE